ncbi:CTR copper uptake transporter [Rhizoctonia solani]|uniref:Copper transport protein n=1 Tax=Rhizoctonia solani TaxID=456999 RepID=A0A0K6FPR3_9AGAM|nr:CTR copper uptake transporter [Rhizoctonia solani]
MNSRLFSYLLCLAAIALAHGGPQTPKENTGSDMMMMTPYFHWAASADALYFKSWVPRTPGGLVGACIGLFCLALFERFLDGARGLVEAWWRRQQASTAARALVLPDNASAHSYSKSIGSGRDYSMNANPVPLIAPFEPVRDLVRGAMQAMQSLLVFFLMLSVMTYNAAFLISVTLGLGIGQFIFGRLARSGAHPGCVAARSHG